MARTTARTGLGLFGLLAGLAGAAGTSLGAQALWLPASDPAGIARAGTGVAFGQSLEAAALNPALLVTLRDDSSAYLSAGMEMQSAQATLQSNSKVKFSADRSRFLPALGAAWKVRPDLFLGFKVDEPFMRHAQMPAEYGGRFIARDIDLGTHRYEVQAAWGYSPALSFGASLGMTTVKYSFENIVRVPVPDLPLEATDPSSNPARGLLELGLVQEGSKTVPSFSLGFRYAVNPRWTVAGAWQRGISGTLGLKARVDARNSALVGTSGFGSADPIAVGAAPVVQGASSAVPGDSRFELPGRFTLGMRNRLNQIFTWEADLRYVQGAATVMPSAPSLATPSGSFSGPVMAGGDHSGFGLGLAAEVTLTKQLTGRAGLAQDPGIRRDPSVEPVLGGARVSSFSAGLAYKAFGGELSVGWLTRLSNDKDVKDLDGQWSLNGYATTGTVTRVENMGHLWSVGFKKAF